MIYRGGKHRKKTTLRGFPLNNLSKWINTWLNMINNSVIWFRNHKILGFSPFRHCHILTSRLLKLSHWKIGASFIVSLFIHISVIIMSKSIIVIDNASNSLASLLLDLITVSRLHFHSATSIHCQSHNLDLAIQEAIPLKKSLTLIFHPGITVHVILPENEMNQVFL